MYVWLYVCRYACRYVCMYVRVCIHNWTPSNIHIDDDDKYYYYYYYITTTDASEMDLHSIAQSFKGQWLSLKAEFLWHVYTMCERKGLPKRLHRSLMNTEVSETLDLALNWHHHSSDKILFLIVHFEIVITEFSGSVNVRTWERILDLLYKHDTRFLIWRLNLK